MYRHCKLKHVSSSEMTGLRVCTSAQHAINTAANRLALFIISAQSRLQAAAKLVSLIEVLFN